MYAIASWRLARRSRPVSWRRAREAGSGAILLPCGALRGGRADRHQRGTPPAGAWAGTRASGPTIAGTGGRFPTRLVSGSRGDDVVARSAARQLNLGLSAYTSIAE